MLSVAMVLLCEMIVVSVVMVQLYDIVVVRGAECCDGIIVLHGCCGGGVCCDGIIV